MGTASKIYGGLAGTMALFAIIGGLWLTSQTFATDVELVAVGTVAAAATLVVSETHERDKATAAEVVKNMRVDAVDQQIRALKKEIKFGDPVQVAYNTGELGELKTLKQNIIEGKR